jgi:hypothetical protein
MALKEGGQLKKVAAAAKYFRIRTQRGFLNIHSEAGDPFRSDNVVGRHQDGDIVEVIAGPVQTEYGPWLQTAEGWSIQVYGGFHWMEQLSTEEAAAHAEDLAAETDPGSRNERNGMKPVTTTLAPAADSDVDQNAVHNGILALRLSQPSWDLFAELRTHQETLQVGLKNYYGFKEVAILQIGLHSRRLRSADFSNFQVHFQAQGGKGALADDSGLQAEIQAAFQAAGSGVTVADASVQWVSTPSTQDADSSPMLMVVIGVLIAVLACFGCLPTLYFRRFMGKKAEKAAPVVARSASDDNASESTNEGDETSECGVGSNPSDNFSVDSLREPSKKETHGQELGPAMY